jgi:hypothetical protein
MRLTCLLLLWSVISGLTKYEHLELNIGSVELTAKLVELEAAFAAASLEQIEHRRLFLYENYVHLFVHEILPFINLLETVQKKKLWPEYLVKVAITVAEAQEYVASNQSSKRLINESQELALNLYQTAYNHTMRGRQHRRTLQTKLSNSYVAAFRTCDATDIFTAMGEEEHGGLDVAIGKLAPNDVKVFAFAASVCDPELGSWIFSKIVSRGLLDFTKPWQCPGCWSNCH